jgi:hypothetical protein
MEGESGDQELFFAAGPIVCEDIETDPRVNDQSLLTTFEAKGKVPVLPPAWQENYEFKRRTATETAA